MPIGQLKMMGRRERQGKRSNSAQGLRQKGFQSGDRPPLHSERDMEATRYDNYGEFLY
jgi:hypothetical protein